MTQTTDSAVFIKNAEGTLVYANDAFARLLFRNSAEEVIGRRSADFFPGEAGDVLRKEDSEVLEKGGCFTIRRKIASQDGKSRVYVFRKFPITIGNTCYLFCLGDEDESGKASSNDGIPVSSEVRARFFSAISHDVRTPLNAIVGYAQILQQAQDPDRCHEAAEAIDEGARNLLSAIDGVMTLLSPESAVSEPTPETFNVSEATLSITESYADAAGANNVELRLKSNPLPLIEFAGTAYKDILGRLLENAVRHTSSGFIKVQTIFDSGNLSLQVSDTGSGMTPDEIGEIMDPNTPAVPDKRPGSATLCLVVAKRICEKLNGTFSISSAPGSGTTVSIVFHNVKTTDGRKRAEFARTQKLRTMRIEDPFRFEKKILVVDDRIVNVRILSLLLGAMGFKNVTTATSGEGALELIRNQDFNMVLTDLMMPGMDGRELLKEIRSLHGKSHLPVYAVTADASAPMTCAQDGFTGILIKPITKEMLKEVL